MRYAALAILSGATLLGASAAAPIVAADVGISWLRDLAVLCVATAHAVCGFLVMHARPAAPLPNFKVTVALAVLSVAMTLGSLGLAVVLLGFFPVRLSPTTAIVVLTLSLGTALASFAVAARSPRYI